MAWTEADLAALDMAIASNGMVRSISFQDQSVSFSSIDEMLRLRALMAAYLAGVSVGAPGNYRFAATNKGV